MDDIFNNSNIIDAQFNIANRLKDIRDIYFIQWQKIHPTSYTYWLFDPESYTKLDLNVLNNKSSTYIVPQLFDLTTLDLFWSNIIAKINNEGLFPYLDDLNLCIFSTPIPGSSMIPFQYIIRGISEPKNINIFLADIARLYNIDSTIIPFNSNTWTVELIIRLKTSDNIDITFSDKYTWIDKLITLYYKRTTRETNQCTISWLAQNILQFIGSAPQYQSSIVTLLQIIFKESYQLDEDSCKYIAQLFKEKWIKKKYRKRCKQAIKQYYTSSLGRDKIIKFIPISSSSSSSSLQNDNNDDDDDYFECPAWQHDNYKVFWNETKCTCSNQSNCLLKHHTIYTLKNCSCPTNQFCILNAIQNELNRLKLIIDSNTIYL